MDQNSNTVHQLEELYNAIDWDAEDPGARFILDLLHRSEWLLLQRITQVRYALADRQGSWSTAEVETLQEWLSTASEPEDRKRFFYYSIHWIYIIISLHLALGRQAEQNGELNQASAYLAGAKDRVAELFAYRPEESSHGPFCWVPIGEEEHRKYEKRRKRHLRDLDRHGLQDPRPAIVEDHLTAFLSMSKSWLKDTLVLLDEMDRFFKLPSDNTLAGDASAPPAPEPVLLSVADRIHLSAQANQARLAPIAGSNSFPTSSSPPARPSLGHLAPSRLSPRQQENRSLSSPPPVTASRKRSRSPLPFATGSPPRAPPLAPPSPIKAEEGEEAGVVPPTSSEAQPDSFDSTGPPAAQPPPKSAQSPPLPARAGSPSTTTTTSSNPKSLLLSSQSHKRSKSSSSQSHEPGQSQNPLGSQSQHDSESLEYLHSDGKVGYHSASAAPVGAPQPRSSGGRLSSVLASPQASGGFVREQEIGLMVAEVQRDVQE